MKKLFFSALVAVVAVGGAFASSKLIGAKHYSVNSQTADIDCTGNGASCAGLYGQAWTKPASDPTRQLVPAGTLAQEFKPQ